MRVMSFMIKALYKSMPLLLLSRRPFYPLNMGYLVSPWLFPQLVPAENPWEYKEQIFYGPDALPAIQPKVSNY